MPANELAGKILWAQEWVAKAVKDGDGVGHTAL